MTGEPQAPPVEGQTSKHEQWVQPVHGQVSGQMQSLTRVASFARTVPSWVPPVSGWMGNDWTASDSGS